MATVTVSAFEEATREQNLDRFVSLAAFANVLMRLLMIDTKLEHLVGEPWGGFVVDDLHVGKLARESNRIETDDDLLYRLWPSEELDEQPGFQLADARALVLAAQLLQAATESPQQLREAVDDLLRRADESATRAAEEVGMDRAFLDSIRLTIAEMKGGDDA